MNTDGGDVMPPDGRTAAGAARFPLAGSALRMFLRAALVALLALPVLAIAVAWLCFDDRQAIVRSAQLTPQDIEKARRLIESQDPRNARPGKWRTLIVGEEELDLMLNYAAFHFGNGAARVALQPGTARLQASIEVATSPFGRFVNVDATLRDAGAIPRVERLRIGRMPVPAPLADRLVREGLQRLAGTGRGALVADAVKAVSIGERRLAVTYVWTDAMTARARSVLLAPEDQARLRIYHDRLVQVSATAPASVSLADLMPPLFRLASERGAGESIARENRAAILVLALYVNGKGLAEIVSAAAQWPRAAPRRVTLAGRDDFPRHFLISAVIAAEAGSPLADAVGLQKEIEDARGGSGFSFNDIGADRAGTRFGEVAVQSPARAAALARTIAAGVREGDFMPDVADLPEFMQEAEFRRRYGGIGAPAYNATMAAIEARVASLPLLR